MEGYIYRATQGFPDGKSDCSNCKGDHCKDCSKSMKYSKAYQENSCGYDCLVNGQWTEGVYTRVHRDQAIINAMRQWQGLSQVDSLSEIGLPESCAYSIQ